MENVIIRKGREKDLEDVLRLVKQLALFEKAPEEVVVTADEYKKDFTEKVFDFLVAEQNEKILGIALFFTKYSTWKGKCIYLDDIVVDEQFRSKGIGHQLFTALIAHCKEQKVRKLDWQVLNWNEHAIRFYKKFDAVFDDEWLNGKITFDK